MTFFYNKGVWQKVPKAQARAAPGRPAISVSWVDAHKGDDLCPNYLSMLVARQIKDQDHSGKSYFAPVRLLEALRPIVCIATTRVV